MLGGQKDELRSFHIDVTRNFDSLKDQSNIKSKSKSKQRDSMTSVQELISRSRLGKKYDPLDLSSSGNQAQMLNDRLRNYDDEYYMGDKLGNLEKKVQNMGKLMIEHTSEKRRILAQLEQTKLAQIQANQSTTDDKRGRVEKKGKEHILNLFKVFNPFNLTSSADAIIKYQEEKQLSALDPVAREIFMKEKKYKEKEMKLKADYKFDLQKLEEKDRQIKEKILEQKRKRELKQAQRRGSLRKDALTRMNTGIYQLPPEGSYNTAVSPGEQITSPHNQVGSLSHLQQSTSPPNKNMIFTGSSPTLPLIRRNPPHRMMTQVMRAQ